MAKNINVVLTLQDRFSKKMSDASYQTFLFNQRLGVAQSISGKFAGAMRVMNVAAGAAAVGAVAFGKQSLDAYRTFNEGMNQVAGIKQLSTASMEYARLTESAREAARSVKGMTFTDSADSLQYMALAGWNTTQSLNALPSLLKAVRISGEETKIVADALTDSMSALGLSSEQTAEYVDMAAAVQSSSNTNMLQLQEALIKSGSLYMNMYGDLNKGGRMGALGDAMAMAGALANVGKKGEAAGTIINSIFNRFVKNTGETAKGFETIGMSIYDDSGSLKSLTNIFSELSEKTKGLSQEERNRALSQIGGRFSSQLITLMDAFTRTGETGETAIEKIQKALENSEGAADEYVETLGTGYAGALDNLSASWTNFKTDMGEDLAPYVTEWANRFTEKLPEIEDWLSERLPAAGENVMTFLEKSGQAVGFIADHAGTIGKTLVALYGGMALFRGGTALVTTGTTVKKFMETAKAAQSANAAWKAFNTSMAASKVAGITGAVAVKTANAAATEAAASVGLLGATLKTLAPIGAGLGIAGALVGIGVAAYALNKKLEKEAIEKRFGKMEISANEAAAAAKALFGGEYIRKRDSVIKAAEDVQEALGETEDSFQRLSKYQLLIEYGGAESVDKESFLAEANTYVENIQSLLADKKIEVAVGTKFLLGENNEVGNKFIEDWSEFSEGLEEEVKKYSDDLKKAVEDAYENGWGESQTAAVKAALEKLKEINEDISEAERQAEITKARKKAELKYNEGDMSLESTKELFDAYKNEYTTSLDTLLDQGAAKLTDAAQAYGEDSPEYKAMEEEVNLGLARGRLDASNKYAGQVSEILKERYGDEYKEIQDLTEKAKEETRLRIQAALDSGSNITPEEMQRIGDEVFTEYNNEYYSGNLSNYDRKPFRELYGYLDGAYEGIQEDIDYINKHAAPGTFTPEKHGYVLPELANLDIMSGFSPKLGENVLSGVNSAIEEAKPALTESGKGVTEAVSDGINEGKGTVEEASAELVNDGAQTVSSAVEGNSGVLNDGGMTIAQKIAQGISSGKGAVLAAIDALIPEASTHFKKVILSVTGQGGNTPTPSGGGETVDSGEHNALGTNYFSGGLTSINENGPEIVDLPRGTRIIPAGRSRQMTERGTGAGIVVNVNIGNLYGEDESYIYRIGDRVAARIAEII